MSGDPYRPNEGGNSLILDFYFQYQMRIVFVFVSGERVKIFNTGLLFPTLEEGAVFCFVSGGPYGPKGKGNCLILDFYWQHFRKVLFVLCLGALTGPREGETL